MELDESVASANNNKIIGQGQLTDVEMTELIKSLPIPCHRFISQCGCLLGELLPHHRIFDNQIDFDPWTTNPLGSIY